MPRCCRSALRRSIACLPGGGLALGALHEVAGGGNGAIDGAAAALFAAGIAARTKGKVLWCVTRQDLFAPALAQAGLRPRPRHLCRSRRRKGRARLFRGRPAPWRAWRGRRRGCAAVDDGLAAPAACRRRRPAPSASRSGAGGGRPRRRISASRRRPSTRWRVSALPSTPLPVPGVGRARWQLELIRCRAGESADFEVEACDAKGRLALPSDLADGPAQKEIGRRRASA